MEKNLRKIEFFSFKVAPKSLKQEWKIATEMVIESGYFIGGPAVEKFESEWAKYLGVNHAIGVGNGYDALVIALKVLGIGKGDLVAVPSHTFVATWLAVGAVGATPIGIDCNSLGLMDLDLLENHHSKLSAVIPVHMHGLMVDMNRLMRWAKKENISVIEDCAQAHGAEFDGRKAGTWGDFGAFSFYPTKNLGAIGDAGSLVTDNEDLANHARSFANYGSVIGHKYSYSKHGLNSRLDPMQAAVLSVNLTYLDSWNARRRDIAKLYSSEMGRIGIRTLQTNPESVFHHFVVLSKDRDSSRRFLDQKGIKTDIHYPSSAKYNYENVSSGLDDKQIDKASKLAIETLSLPMSPWLKDSDLDYLFEVINVDSVRSSFLGLM